MEPLGRNKWFSGLVLALLGLAVIVLLVQIKPVLVWVYDFLKAVLAPFLIAMIVSYVLNPVVCLLHDRKVPRTVAVLLIYAVFLTSGTVVLMNVIPVFLMQVNEINEHIPQLTMKAQNWMTTLNDHPMLPDSIRKGVYRAMAKLETNVSTAISDYLNRIGSTLNALLMAFIIPFLAFYMLKDFQLIEKSAIAFVPKSHRKQTVQLLTEIDEALGSYIRGQFLVCLIVGGLAYAGYWLIDMPYALLLASLVAIFNIVPYLGPYLGAAPAILMASTISWRMVLYVVIVNTAVQILESNVVSPQVVGRTLHMHPLSIIFALLVGGELAGILGMILAVPVFAVLKVIAHHVSIYYGNRRPT
ncbi:AI-2E family transporter [Paenibacillus sp. J31TS4]|uniref:AI-2E family transporter n=1 Tax=Paenibacillus sp. J31TS4 TaxID=2807195 RepID=UPI001B02FCA9|nr:AI-2E family transporter [Paenibacillus sp. J31TS4]GIP39253.1 AI-2E family transporter [Paenibacillus sp. J31TS4]